MDGLLQILNNPIWQSIGAIISAIALGISIIFFAINRRQQKKEVTFFLITNVPLFRASPQIRDKLKVLYEEKEVSDLSLIQYKIENSGQIPITPDDYVKPICISVSPNANIIETEITASSPSNLGLLTTQTNQSTIELSQSLLNPGDYIIGKIIVSNNDNTIKSEARIVGVPSIAVRWASESFNIYPLIRLGLFAVVLTGIATFLFSITFNINIIFGWLVVLSVINFSLFGFDKFQAMKARLRVPEIVFFTLSLMGGSVGAYLGMQIFNHKTRVTSFRILIPSIIFFQVVIAIIYLL